MATAIDITEKPKKKAMTFITPDLHDYMLEHSVEEPALLQKLRQETSVLEKAYMQVTADQGNFLSLLVKMTKAKKVLEVGVFTGYSSICMSQALPDDGKLVGLDISEEWTNVARRYYVEGGVEKKVTLMIAPAQDSLYKLKETEPESFDLAFLDADKPNYPILYEKIVPLIKKGGVIAIDNVLWYGNVINKDVSDLATNGVRGLNEKVKNDKRVHVSMIAIGDGLTLAYKL